MSTKKKRQRASIWFSYGNSRLVGNLDLEEVSNDYIHAMDCLCYPIVDLFHKSVDDKLDFIFLSNNKRYEYCFDRIESLELSSTCQGLERSFTTDYFSTRENYLSLSLFKNDIIINKQAEEDLEIYVNKDISTFILRIEEANYDIIDTIDDKEMEVDIEII